MSTQSSRLAPVGSAKTGRCAACRLRSDCCICDLTPTLMLTTKVVLVAPVGELSKPSNTGRLVHASLPNSELLMYGLPHQPISFSSIDPSVSVQLFPGPNSQVLTSESIARLPHPLTLVVPDGTWSQARRISQRITSDLRLPHVTLENTPESRYLLRRNRRSGGVCTIEAVAMALGLLEGPEVSRTLMSFFSALVIRTLWSRETVEPFPGEDKARERLQIDPISALI